MNLCDEFFFILITVFAKYAFLFNNRNKSLFVLQTEWKTVCHRLDVYVKKCTLLHRLRAYRLGDTVFCTQSGGRDTVASDSYAIKFS